MKNLLLSLLVCIACVSHSYAQPGSSTFPDFTYEDIEGNTHHLQSYLDQGKTVVIDVFATWCSVCNNSIPGLEELYNTLGQGGDNSLVVLSFERDASTTNEAAWAASNNVEVPIITGAEDLILNTWNYNYQPRYLVICPDGSFEQAPLGGIGSNPQVLVDLSEECATVSGLTEINLKEQFTLAGITPEGILNVRVDLKNVNYQVIDLTGSVAKTGDLTQGNHILDMSSLRAGMYFLTAIYQNERITLRFIKS